MKPVWLLYHVPKTGGQTIRDVLIQQVGIGPRYMHLGRVDPADKDFPKVDDVAALSERDRAEMFAVTGHPVDYRLADIFAGRRAREVIILREPAERIVSHYNFFVTRPSRAHKPPMAFDDWYEQRHHPDFGVDWLAKRLGTAHDPGEVATRLANCWFVGRTPNLTRFLPHLLQAMGLDPVLPARSNVTGVHHQRVLALDGPLRQRLIRDNPGDTMLYRMARTLERLSLQRLETWPS